MSKQSKVNSKDIIVKAREDTVTKKRILISLDEIRSDVESAYSEDSIGISEMHIQGNTLIIDL